MQCDCLGGGRRHRRSVLQAENLSAGMHNETEAMLLHTALGGTGGENALTESVTLTFSKVTISYGDVSRGWDIAGNVKT